MEVIGYGTKTASAELSPLKFNRRDVRAGEIAIEISHCGVCHSDLHQARDDWDNTQWPCIPGHEIVGKVVEVGDGVSRFAIGDRVFHQKFGNGNVRRVDGNKIEVEFDHAGMKKVVGSFLSAT